MKENFHEPFNNKCAKEVCNNRCKYLYHMYVLIFSKSSLQSDPALHFGMLD